MLSRFQELLEYNPLTGEFKWLKDHSSRARKGTIAGYKDELTGYLLLGIDGKLYLQHRLAWLFMTGEWPVNQIDHKNLIKEDNKFLNLREANNKQNHENVTKNANNTSGYVGVSFHKRSGRFMAFIGHNNKKHFLGYFGTAEDANAVRVEAKKTIHTFNPIGV